MLAKLLIIMALTLVGCGSNQNNTAESNVTGDTGAQREHLARLAVTNIEVAKLDYAEVINGLRGNAVDLRVTGISDGFMNNFFGIVPQDANGIPGITRNSQFSAECTPRALYKETATRAPDRNNYRKTFYRVSDGAWYEGTRGGGFFLSGNSLYVAFATWDLERALLADNRTTLVKFADVHAGRIYLESRLPLAVDLRTLVRKELSWNNWSVPKKANGMHEGDARCYLIK